MGPLFVVAIVSSILNGTARFLIAIDYRGRHSKGIAICNVTEVNLQQKHFRK
jgi:hypothetical protein